MVLHFYDNKLIRIAKKLYVGGLPWKTTDDELRAHFEAAGEVASASVIVDRVTQRSKGFGFIEMVNDADADKAISMFHDQDFGGRRLTVNVARPKEDRPARRDW